MGTARLVDVPAKTDMVIVRAEYMAITGGDACAAALLNYFERWTIWRKDHGQELWISVKNQQELIQQLLGVFTISAVKRALALLRDCGFLKAAKRYANKWDHRLHYALVVEAIQDAINAVFSPPDDTQTDDRLVSTDQPIGQHRPTDRSAQTNRSVSTDQSTLEDQNLDQDYFEQLSLNQEKAAGARDAAAADLVKTEDREGEPLEKTFFEAKQALKRLTTPPSSATPPSPSAEAAAGAVKVFEANIRPAGAVVRREIDAAVARLGEAVVIGKIEQAAKRGARTWAYVEKMLADGGAGAGASAAADEWLMIEPADEKKATMSPEARHWSETVDLLEMQLERSMFDLWVKGARMLRVDGNVYVIGVENRYAVNMLNVRLKRTVERALCQFAGDGVTFVVEPVVGVPA